MRLNTINAAIGRIQLQNLDDKIKRRREIAAIYIKFLSEDCILPENRKGMSVYNQIVLKHKNRDEIVSHLSKNNIGVAIHYSVPLH